MENPAIPSDSDVDALLLAEANAKWQKVAMVVARAMKAHDVWDSERVTARIAALTKAGKLETAGNIRNWRFSEARLPVKSD